MGRRAKFSALNSYKKRGKPRKYIHDVRCPDCGSSRCKRNGHQKGKQRYRSILL